MAASWLTARAVRAAFDQPCREGDGVHGAGTGAGDGLDLEPPILEQMVEHPPGEGAMGTAALKSERDVLLARGRVHGAGGRRRLGPVRCRLGGAGNRLGTGNRLGIGNGRANDSFQPARPHGGGLAAG
jgi:hypothetical protein